MASWSGMVFRGFFLFGVGVFFFWICDALQKVRGGIVDPDSSIFDLINLHVWVPIGCGFASVIVGLLSPFIDFKLGLSDVYKEEWSSVLRCVAVFFGLNHATARMDFASYFQLATIVLSLSFGLWWIFDRSSVGLGCGMTVALIATTLGLSFARRHLLRAELSYCPTSKRSDRYHICSYLLLFVRQSETFSLDCEDLVE
ncbi:hypothetical protein AHF37_00173 [Paragonimus kellicotti]|nr:hypothetical protein AHF37_00173 [Paragonimus kellicotti]